MVSGGWVPPDVMCTEDACTHTATLLPEGLGEAQVAQLEASIREVERDVRGHDEQEGTP